MTSENRELPHELAETAAVDSQFDELGQAADDEAVSSGEAADSLEYRLAEADREVLRAKAEMENFRKRLQREAEQQLKYANLSLVRDLLEVIDNLQRAIQASVEEEGATQALRDGVVMVSEQLQAVLTKYACKPIDALGTTFDPNIHEAIAQAPSEEHEAGHVMQEVTKGYLLHDRVARPSSVIVSSGSKHRE